MYGTGNIEICKLDEKNGSNCFQRIIFCAFVINCFNGLLDIDLSHIPMLCVLYSVTNNKALNNQFKQIFSVVLVFAFQIIRNDVYTNNLS